MYQLYQAFILANFREHKPNIQSLMSQLASMVQREEFYAALVELELLDPRLADDNSVEDVGAVSAGVKHGTGLAASAEVGPTVAGFQSSSLGGMDGQLGNLLRGRACGRDVGTERPPVSSTIARANF